jgi:hypothetical protein
VPHRGTFTVSGFRFLASRGTAARWGGTRNWKLEPIKARPPGTLVLLNPGHGKPETGHRHPPTHLELRCLFFRFPSKGFEPQISQMDADKTGQFLRSFPICALCGICGSIHSQPSHIQRGSGAASSANEFNLTNTMFSYTNVGV